MLFTSIRPRVSSPSGGTYVAKSSVAQSFHRLAQNAPWCPDLWAERRAYWLFDVLIAIRLWLNFQVLLAFKFLRGGNFLLTGSVATNSSLRCESCGRLQSGVENGDEPDRGERLQRRSRCQSGEIRDAMTVKADIAVIGLGAVGCATLYQAALRGAQVIGLDRFHPPHDQGSSHGDTRITRQAIGEGREFVPLVLRSDEIWQKLEADTGLTLATRHGGLVMASAGVAGSHHGSHSFVEDTIQAAAEFGIAHETLNAEEVQRRYPQFRLRGDEMGYFEPGAGFLRPEACITAQLSEAKRLGANVFTGETALELKAAANSVEIVTDRNTYSTSHAIVTIGPWIREWLAAHKSLFRIYRQVMNWFAIAQNAERYSPERFPIFIWLTGAEPRDMLYGFPAVDGSAGGVKVSTEQYDATVDPAHVSRTVPAAEVDAMFAEYIQPRFPDLSGRCLRSQTCLYTVTPDAKFIVDRLGDDSNVLFASACSGHGFKHSAALGEALALQSLGDPAMDLSPFRLRRFG